MSAHIQNHESFGPAVYEITRLQGLEKLKTAAISMKMTEPCEKPSNYYVVRTI